MSVENAEVLEREFQQGQLWLDPDYHGNPQIWAVFHGPDSVKPNRKPQLIAIRDDSLIVKVTKYKPTVPESWVEIDPAEVVTAFRAAAEAERGVS